MWTGKAKHGLDHMVPYIADVNLSNLPYKSLSPTKDMSICIDLQMKV